MSGADSAIMVGMSSSTLSFACEFLREPRAVASVTPSSQALSRQVSLPIPASGQPTVIELGPGTGAFTRQIQATLGGRGHHLAVDVNARFTALLGERFPGLDAVTADARELPGLLRERGLPHADVIVSGLPWAAFDAGTQRDILDALTAVLHPDGGFTTFAYVHARWSGPARRFRSALHDRFEEVVLGRTVWANVPPALVYHCRRPRRP